jgi:S1-C subfamily serine protease
MTDAKLAVEHPAKPTLKKMLEQYGDAVLPVVATDKLGDEGIGSAFHIGEGVFVTARHVVENKTGTHVLLNAEDIPGEILRSAPERDDYFETHPVDPFFHKDPDIDVAVFRIERYAFLPAIELGGHLDDWINDRQFLLNEVLVIGYPPIPFAFKPLQIATRGHVSGVADLRHAKHVHFILSLMARGGFSGGPVLSEWNFALGVVTMSLLKDHAPEELGYLTVLSVEPILECLEHNGMMTAGLTAAWGDLFKPGYSARRGPAALASKVHDQALANPERSPMEK